MTVSSMVRSLVAGMQRYKGHEVETHIAKFHGRAFLLDVSTGDHSAQVAISTDGTAHVQEYLIPVF